MIHVDGANHEAGGQVLRSALALSICTRQPFRMSNIRIHRDMPGLLRQHLAAVNAAADIANADVDGARLGARDLTFRPRACHGGQYTFDVGLSGSCSLIFQTVLPALMFADAASSVRITGNTHIGNAPAFDFLQRAFVPLLQRMGVQLELNLVGFGFHPNGGGGIHAEIKPSSLRALVLEERGMRISQFAEVSLAGLPADVAQRELATIGRRLHWSGEQLHVRRLPANVLKGNTLTITLAYENVTEVFATHADTGIRAEVIAESLAQEAERYLDGSAPVGVHLADQLLLPLALCGRGSFVTSTLSGHFAANVSVIEQFTARSVVVARLGDNYKVAIA